MSGIERISGKNPFAVNQAFPMAPSAGGVPGVSGGEGVSPASRTPRFQGADGGLQNDDFQKACANNCYANQKLQPASYSAPLFGGYGQARDIAFA